MKYEEWNNPEVFELFKYYGFKRFIERFGLVEGQTDSNKDTKLVINKESFLQDCKLYNKEFKDIVLPEKELIYFIVQEKYSNDKKIIKKSIIEYRIIDRENTI